MLGTAKSALGVVFLVLLLLIWVYGFLWIFLQREYLGVKKIIFLVLLCTLFSVIFSMYVYWNPAPKNKFNGAN